MITYLDNTQLDGRRTIDKTTYYNIIHERYILGKVKSNASDR
jgi:hypothetical protein